MDKGDIPLVLQITIDPLRDRALYQRLEAVPKRQRCHVMTVLGSIGLTWENNSRMAHIPILGEAQVPATALPENAPAILEDTGLDTTDWASALSKM